MKKFVCAILIFCLCLIVSGCGGDDLSSAKLLGYNGNTFEKTMSQACDAMNNEEVASLNCEWITGWNGSGAPDAANLTSNEKPVTYVITVNLSHKGAQETNRMAYYLIHNTKENILSVQGGYFDEDGHMHNMTLSEARAELEDIFEEYN